MPKKSKTPVPSTKHQALQTEVAPFTRGSMMSTPLDEMSIADQVRAYKAVDFVEKQAKERKSPLRASLLAHVEAHGAKAEKSLNEYVVIDGFRVTREHRRESAPNAETLKTLLEEHGIPLEEAFDTVKVLQASPSKIKYLVDSGKITAKEAESLHGVTHALKVTEPKEMKPLLAECKPTK